MKRFQAAIFFLMCLAFLIINISGCRQNEKNETQQQSKNANEDDDDDYNARVNNVVRFLQDYNVADTACMDVVILQTNGCNLCTENDLKVIRSEFAAPKERLLFILNAASHSGIINSFFKKSQAVFVIDVKNKLGGYGLLFAKNLHVKICNSKVISWNFYN